MFTCVSCFGLVVDCQDAQDNCSCCMVQWKTEIMQCWIQQLRLQVQAPGLKE